MRRLVWLLLAAFCIALVQVQPVEGLVAKSKACACCCQEKDRMPDCCPQPTSSQAETGLPQAETVATDSSLFREEAASELLAHAYAFLTAAAAIRSPIAPSIEGAVAAEVPLFRAHCSLLI